MTRKRVALVVFCAVVLVAMGSAQADVITVTPVQKVTGTGEEPAEWEYTNGWSVVTNKLGVGKTMVSGPSFCEAKYEPYTAYELENIAGGDFPRWVYLLDPPVGGNPIPKYNMGKGAFYASCDIYYGQTNLHDPPERTPSTVWLGTDQHAGQTLVGVALRQIKTAKYCTFVSRNPTWFKPGAADSNWGSFKESWYNPRFPIQFQFCVAGPEGRKQFWYRPWGGDPFIGDNCSDGRLGIWEEHICVNRAPGADPDEERPRWLAPPFYDGNPFTTYETWDDVLATYGDYTLVATSTTYVK